MLTPLTYVLYRYVYEADPSSGDTLYVDVNGNENCIIMNPVGGPIALLNVQFPDDGHSILGQHCEIWTSQTVTSMTYNGFALVGGVSTPIQVDNGPNTLLANTACEFVKVGPLHWVCKSNQ